MQIAFPNISSSAILLLCHIFWFSRLVRDWWVTSVCSTTCLWAECRHPLTCYSPLLVPIMHHFHSVHTFTCTRTCIYSASIFIGPYTYLTHVSRLYWSNIFTRPIFSLGPYFHSAYVYSVCSLVWARMEEQISGPIVINKSKRPSKRG